ncbi:MAG: Hpt domain-containing protein [Sediminicola sp.]
MTETPNLKYLDDLAQGDEGFRKKFIGILKEEFPSEKQCYLDAMENGFFREASEHVHKIKHKLNVLGVHKSYSLAVRHENELRKGGNKYHMDFLSVLSEIEAYLKTI